MNMNRVLQAVFILAVALQQTATAITAPVDGQTLQAQVAISGTIDPANFASAELAFGYASDSTSTWFLIQIVTQPPQDGTLAVWDTANLTDGDYRLRLRVFRFDGSFEDYFVNDLHLRNAAPPATATVGLSLTATAASTELALTAEPKATETPAPAVILPAMTQTRPTSLPLSPNPATITARAVYSVLGRGALLVLLLFIVIGMFLRLRRS